MDDMFSARHIHKLAGQFVNTRWHDLQSKPKQWLCRQKKKTVLYSNCRTVWTWKLLLLQFYAWTSFPSRFLSQTFCCKINWWKELFELGTCRGFCGRRPQRPWSPAWEHWGRPSSLATLILMFSEIFLFSIKCPHDPDLTSRIVSIMIAKKKGILHIKLKLKTAALLISNQSST